ncbi:MAG: DUF1232 domain-containing protein [Bacteroidales bacterium]|nr:DUF1232 domain-containing protein [Bacteroidales bacterium]
MNDKDIEIYRKEYSDNRFSAKIAKAAKSAGRSIIKKALLLYYVMKSKDVPFKEKAKICAALGYFIVPLDLVADFVPFIGYGDDLAAIAWALHSVYSKVTPEIDKEAEEHTDRLLK